jgi:hypothetical protein
MNRLLCRWVIVAVAMATLGCGPRDLTDKTPASAEGTPEAKAKEITRQFVKALRNSDKAAVLKLVDVPYFDNAFLAVITDRSALEKDYDTLIGVWSHPKNFPPNSIDHIVLYSEIRAKQKKEWLKKTFDKVMAPDDLIVVLGDGPDEERYVFVRLKPGAVKVVGVTIR